MSDEYICHFCIIPAKVTGYSGEKVTAWRCNQCDTEYHYNPNPAFFLPQYSMEFRVYPDDKTYEMGYYVVVDYIDNNTQIYRMADLEKPIIIPFLAKITPTTKEDWLKRILKLKAFL